MSCRPASCSLFIVLALTGCGEPIDQRGTSERVQGGTLNVGVTDNPPWVRLGGDRPGGIEPRLIESFARAMHARIRWVKGSESSLLTALEQGELDLVAGGLTDRSPWSSRLAMTLPYLRSNLVVAVPRQAADPARLKNLAVVTEPGSPAAALLRRKGARPVAAGPSAAGETGAEAMEDWEAEARHYRATDFELEKERHVLATSSGENGFLMRLERHLQATEGDLPRLLASESRK